MTTGSRSKRKQWIPIVALLISAAIGWSWDHWFRKVPVAVLEYRVELDQRDATKPASLQVSLVATTPGLAEMLEREDACPVAITLLKPDGTYVRCYQQTWLTLLSNGVPATQFKKLDAGVIRTWKVLEPDLAPAPLEHHSAANIPDLTTAAEIWVEPSLVGEGVTAPASCRPPGIDSE